MAKSWYGLVDSWMIMTETQEHGSGNASSTSRQKLSLQLLVSIRGNRSVIIFGLSRKFHTTKVTTVTCENE